MKLFRQRSGRGIAALCAALITAVSAAHGATASDLETLQSRARSITDEITALERRLQGLHFKQSRLQGEITMLSGQIGSFESDILDAERAYDVARDRYVARAVELYKGGQTTRLAMLLSTGSLTELLEAADLAGVASDLDARALEDLVAARNSAELGQRRLDDRKQRLMAAQAEVETVGTEMEVAIAERRARFAELSDEIAELEADAARRAAREEKRAKSALDTALAGAGPVRGIPKDFVSTGVSFEGVASWYGPGFAGNPTASGAIFDPMGFTAASLDLPLGTWLYVEYSGHGVIVLVNDRGPYIDDRILDLSQGAAEALGITGLGWIRATIVVKRR